MIVKYSIQVSEAGEITSLDYETLKLLCRSAIEYAGAAALKQLAVYPAGEPFVFLYRGVPFKVVKDGTSLTIEGVFEGI